MKLAAPVNASCEVEELFRAGADELYCGFFDEKWQASYGRHDSMNRRQGEANFSSWEDLKSTVAEAKSFGVPVYLTVNSRYSGSQYPAILSLIDRWRSIGGSGIIVRDIGLLYRLKKANAGKNLKITASLLIPAFNHYAVEMLREYGVSRVVFPRCLSIGEMKAVCSKNGDMEFEAMIMGDKCRMIDGFCRSIHAENYLSGCNKACFSQIDYSKGCVHLCMQYGAPQEDPCAVCSLPDLEAAGVSIGKTGGRGTPLHKRVEWLAFIKRSRELSASKKKELYQSTFSHSCSCYYTDKAQPRFLPDCKSGYLPKNAAGHHSCPGAFGEIKAYLGKNAASGGKNVFVIPPVTPDHIEDFEEIIDLISKRLNENEAELVLNDYGALAYCGKMKSGGNLSAKLTAGLLLSGQDTDPFYAFSERNESSENLLRHLSEPSIFFQKEFLSEYGISGIELCRQPVEIKPFASFCGDVNIRVYPFSVLSVKPCCGDCEKCREKTVVRNGKSIISNKNMFIYTDSL